MPEKTKEEDDEKDDSVVHLEERDVGFDTGNSVVEVGWEVEGTEIEEEFPWTASSEAGFEAVFGACDEFEVCCRWG